MNPLEDREGQALVALMAGYILGVMTSPDSFIPSDVRGDPDLSADGVSVRLPFEVKSGRHIDVTVALVE